MESKEGSTCRRVFSLRTLGIISLVIVIAALIYQPDYSKTCLSLISNGQWVSDRWYPYQCIIERSPESYLQNTAIQAYALFIGEKSLLDYYKALAVQISSRNKITLSNDFDIDKNFPLTFSTPDKLYTSDYIWSSKMDQSVLDYYQNMLKAPIKSLPSIIVHQHLEYEVEDKNSPPIYVCTNLISQLIDKQTKYMTNYNGIVNTTGLDPTIIILLYDVSVLSEVSRQCQYILEDMYNKAIKSNPLFSQHVILLHLDLNYNNKHQWFEVLTHFISNSRQHSTCCFTDITLSLNFIVPVLFVLYTIYVGLVFVRATGTLIPLEPYFEGASIDLNHVYSIIHLFGTIVTVLFYCSSTEKYFANASPITSILLFNLLLVAIVCLGFMKRETISQPTEVMSKEHTNEWRGWTVLILVALEYSNTAETGFGSWLWILMISHLSCICGYTHFVSFWDSNDYSLKNIFKKVFHINYLTIWLCITLHSSYGLYVVPSIMTQVLITVYYTMATPPRLSSVNKNVNSKIVTIKMICSLLIAVVVTAVELSVDPQAPTSFILGLNTSLRNGQMWTTPYVARVMSFLGMAIAYCYKRNQSPLIATNYLKVLFVILSFTLYGVFISLVSVSGTSQILHLIPAALIITSYVCIRNWTTILRNHYSFVYEYVGRMSIEFYVLFQHVMLCYKTKGLVFLFPSYYSFNMLATLVTLLYLSMTLSKWSRKVTKSRVSSTPNQEEEEDTTQLLN